MLDKLLQRYACRDLAYSLGFPLVVLVGAWLLLINLDRINTAYLQLLIILPYALLALIVALALRFGLARIAMVALSLLTLYWATRFFLQAPLEEPRAHYIYTAISLLLPLNIGLAILMPERGVRSRAGLYLLAMVPVEMAVVWLGWQGYVINLVPLFESFATRPIAGIVISPGAAAWFVAILLLGLVQGIRRHPGSIEALVGSLLATFVMLAWFQLPLISSVMVTAGGILLVGSLLNVAHRLAYRDDLTGLLGRRALNERLDGLSRYSLAMLDVDHFKKFNDSYGHDAGDEALKVVAKHLNRMESGIPYRYGGEEFVVLFPGASLDDCIQPLEELRRDIAAYDMSLRDHGRRPGSDKAGASRRSNGKRSQRVKLTISIGVAQCEGRGLSPEDSLKAADEALYRAKSGGRNRLVRAG